MGNSFSSRDIIRVLQQQGFVFVSQKGSHVKLEKAALGPTKVVIVPHPKKDIPFGTFNSICRQAGIPTKEMVTLLR